MERSNDVVVGEIFIMGVINSLEMKVGIKGV